MNAPSTFVRLRGELADMQRAGRTSVEIEPLLSFLDSTESNDPSSSEVRKLQHDSKLAHYKAKRESDMAMFQSVLDSAKTALTTSILMNGGAAVALLALLGNLLGKYAATTPLPSQLVFSLVSFAGGVLLGGLATGSTYLTQYCYSKKHRRSGIGLHVLTVLLVVATYVAFLAGVFNAYLAFKR